MKLTIGMIVKNEEKWLDKCLSAIKPILDNVDSELIITDTGSTDRTVEIAKKYTDKVLHFDWIKDFSAARNFGLQKAQGEWFMMLDADDIFRSCDHIIEFFNSGEYKKYNAASYISRNIIKTENGDSFGDLLAPRMVKLHPHTRYENSVHEYLNTFDPPYKNIRDIADHYGYYYETEQDKIRKFERNSELLLKRYETEKDTTPMLYVQLYEAFMGVGDSEKALFYLNGGIELSKKMNSIVLASLYCHKACYYQTDKEYDKALAVCDEYFEMNKVIRPHPLNTDGEIYAIRAVSLYECERYAEAVEAFKSFFDIYRDIESGKLATYDSYLTSEYMCSEVNILPLFNKFIESCIKAEKFNTADNYLCTYPIHKYCFEPQRITELVCNELMVAEHFSYNNIAVYYKRLDNAGKKILADELFERSRDAGKREAMLGAVGGLAKNDSGIGEKLDIYKAYYSGRDTAEDIKRFIAGNGISNDVDLIGIMLEKQYDLSPVFTVEDVDLKQCVFLCCRNIKGFYELAENYDASRISDESVIPNAVKFYDYCIGMRLVENEDKPEDEKRRLIEKLYKVKSELGAHVKKENALSEFQQLAAAIKRNIRAYIAAGNTDAARKTLDEYCKINPSDPEIKAIKASL